MLRAAIVGIGTWGRNLVASVQGKSDALRFVAGATRTPAKAAEFCSQHGIGLLRGYESLLKNSDVDAVVLATPPARASRSALPAGARSSARCCSSPRS